MGITDSIKAQAVSALRQCAREHEKDITPTFHIRVSDLCNDVAEYVEKLQKENAELKAQIEKMKNCNNCRYNGSSKKQNVCIYSYCCNDCNKGEMMK